MFGECGSEGSWEVDLEGFEGRGGDEGLEEIVGYENGKEGERVG